MVEIITFWVIIIDLGLAKNIDGVSTLSSWGNNMYKPQ